MVERADSTIKITSAEAHSSHVDDLLRRQASLRGDPGITRDTGGKWYYQNWFILMLAGLVAAILGWAMIEPLIDDLPYIEGSITSVSPRVAADPPGVSGHLGLGKYDLLVLDKSRQQESDGKWHNVVLDAYKPGDHLGVYLDRATLGMSEEEGVEGATIPLVADFLIPNASTGASSDLQYIKRKDMLGSLLFFPIAAGMVGLFIGAADGLICRLPRRMILAGIIGLIVGLVGGFISSFIADLIYGPISEWASKNHAGAGGLGLSTFGFLVQLCSRSLGWAVAGVTMGLGQGFALRSGKIILYGLLGGLIGGLLGGLLFDPIYLLVSGEHNPSAHWSRMISIAVIGLSVGLMIGIVELLARDAWLRMVAGPLAGKEFLMFKNTMNVGASPKSDIYLFNDEGVAQQHAVIRATGDAYEIEGLSDVYPLTVNSRAVTRTRLRHGDQIGLGRTLFVFQRKRG